MPWVKDRQSHTCQKPYLWFSKEGQRWQCAAKLTGGGRCGKLWEVVRAGDMTGDGQLVWREVGGLAQAVADKRREVDAVADRLERESLKRELAAEWLRHVGEPTSKDEVLDTDGELAVIQWTLQELERRGLAKWAHE